MKLLLLVGLFLPLSLRAEDELPDGALRRIEVTEDGEGVLWSIAFSPDGKTLACGGSLRKMHLIDARGGELLRSFGTHLDNVWAVAWSPDGKLLCSGGRADLTLRAWNPVNGDELASFEGHKGGITRLRFFRDGRRLIMAGGSWDPIIRVWDVARREQVLALTGHTDFIDAMDLAAHGRLAISGSRDGSLRVWSITRGREVYQQRLEGENAEFYSVAFSPDGRTFAFGTSAGLFEVRETCTRRRCLPASERNGSIHAIAYSPDGRLVAFASETKQVVVWDTRTGKEVRAFRGHRAQVRGLAFSPDGQLLASCASDSLIVLWKVPALADLSRRLSDEERATQLANLGSENPVAARLAVVALANDPAFTVAHLAPRLRPAEVANEKQLDQWIEQLGSSKFAERERATAELERCEEQAESALLRAWEAGPALEPRRRLERLLDRLDRHAPKGELLWHLRAVAVLEGRGDADARPALEKLAAGAAGARVTLEAREALERKGRR